MKKIIIALKNGTPRHFLTQNDVKKKTFLDLNLPQCEKLLAIEQNCVEAFL
jgi:hypothetical protein